MKTNKKPQFPKIFTFSFSFFSLNSCSPPLSFFLSTVTGPGCLAEASFPPPLPTALCFFRSCRQCPTYNTNTITNNFGFVKRSGPGCFFFLGVKVIGFVICFKFFVGGSSQVLGWAGLGVVLLWL